MKALGAIYVDKVDAKEQFDLLMRTAKEAEDTKKVALTVKL